MPWVRGASWPLNYQQACSRAHACFFERTDTVTRGVRAAGTDLYPVLMLPDWVHATILPLADDHLQKLEQSLPILGLTLRLHHEVAFEISQQLAQNRQKPNRLHHF